MEDQTGRAIFGKLESTVGEDEIKVVDVEEKKLPVPCATDSSGATSDADNLVLNECRH